MADLLATESAMQDAVVEGSNAKQARAWLRFNLYLTWIGYQHDPILESLSRAQCHRILAAFAHAVWEGRYSTKNHPKLKSESVRATLAQTFKLADKPDPRLDRENKFAFILQCQLRSYANTNKPVTPQAAITGSILREFYILSISSSSDKALCKLFIGAFFFAMQSCEYVNVSRYRKTKLLKVDNIRFFFKGNKIITHSDPDLYKAEFVAITFEFQKRDTKNDIITQHRLGNTLLCPVHIWCSIIRRLCSYPSTTLQTTVNTFLISDGKLHLFTGRELLHRLRIATRSIGPDILGCTAELIGLHSAWSGAAMAMYLAGVTPIARRGNSMRMTFFDTQQTWFTLIIYLHKEIFKY